MRPRPKIAACLLTTALGSILEAGDRGTAQRAEELRRLTLRRFEANAANDRAFYERLLAPNALVAVPNRSPRTKQEYLDEEFGARPAGFKGTPATIVSFRALVDGDTGTASYQANEPTPIGDTRFEVRTLRLDTYLRIQGAWRLLSMSAAEVPSWPDTAAVDPKLYAEYAGTYELAPGLLVVITEEAGHLMSQMTGQEKAELFPENATTFFDRSDSPLARTVFERDASGKVATQAYRSHGQTLRARKLR